MSYQAGEDAAERGRRPSQLEETRMDGDDSSLEASGMGEGPSSGDTPRRLNSVKRSMSRSIARRTASVKGVNKALTVAHEPGSTASDASAGTVEWDVLKDHDSEERDKDQGLAVRARASNVSLRGTRSNSPSGPDPEAYATFIAQEQQATIAKLEASKHTLLEQLAARNKTIADLKHLEKENAALVDRERTLEKQISTLKDTNAELTEKVKSSKSDQADYMTARSAMVLEDAKKNIQIKKLQDELDKVLLHPMPVWFEG
ncbi:hypothetical protein BC830DRAFT_1155899 [Chytriomyces sp. MP71]|nr:hypothetical protein BC830DRAFT_1155899 [Chytriomyces sp. MP71]